MAGEMEFENEKEGTTLWGVLRGIFSTGSEYADMTEEKIDYRRKLLDYRIEAFLDKHLHDYISDFGILDEASLEVRNERISVMEERSDGLIHFVRETEEDISELEDKVSALEKGTKKK